jgi:hypothetical protein
MRRPVALMLTVTSLIGGLIFGGVLFVAASTSIEQLGSDIDGEAAGDESGWSVSLSSDGTIVAISTWKNDGANGAVSDAGHVRVFQYSSGSWTQLGPDIDGEAADDQSGRSVSLSSDGTIVAIGAIGNDGAAGAVSNAGHVRVYEWSGSAWVQMGGDIDGEAANDESGWSVSLSSDGTEVAIGAYKNDGAAGAVSNAGHVRVYEWDGSAWQQKGSDIDGEAANDASGRSVSLSADGTEVAIGANRNDGAAGAVSDAGHVRVYEWSGGAWVQKGGDIDGEAANDWSGYSVSLSSDGAIVAIGAFLNDGKGSDAGHVRVYEWDGSAWQQKGGDIDGEAAGDYSGISVSLSSDGTEVAIGAHLNDGNGSKAGHVRVYEWDGSAWQQKGSDIDGEAAGDASGWSVSLSSDGTEVAISAGGNDGAAGAVSNAGHVRVYSITTSTPTTTPAASGPRVPGQVPPWPEAIPNVDGTVTVSWAEPFQDGAGPITGYRAVARPQTTGVAQASDAPVSMTSGGSCSTTGFVCVIAGLEENVDYLFEVFASNSEGESAGRMTQQAIRIVPQTPATTIPVTVPDTLPAVVDQQPLPVTGNDDDLVTWSLLLIAFGALSGLYVRRTRLN